MPSKYSVGKRPQCASASKAKFSLLSELSGLENVLFNDFIDDELDSEDVSEQRTSVEMTTPWLTCARAKGMRTSG